MGVVNDIQGRLDNNLKAFKFNVLEVQTVTRERYELFEKSLLNFKESIELKV